MCVFLNNPDKLVGMVGVITMTEGQTSEIGEVLDGWDYEVKFNEQGNYFHYGKHAPLIEQYRYFDSSELELVEAKSETKTKYKVGDVVTVRSDLITGYYEMANGSNRTRVSDQMLTKRGEKVTIESITKNGKYKVKGSMFVWTDGMFEDNVKAEPKKITEREPKVGDRIKMITDFCGTRKNMTGTIKKCNRYNYSVEFDLSFEGGHDCDGNCKCGYGHYVCREHFELIEEDNTQYIVCQVRFGEGGLLYSYLTEDTTITVGSEVTVPCGKGDHWAVATVQRIGYYTESDTPYPFDKMKKVICKGVKQELYNGEVVCVDSNDDDFTIGKVYRIKDGKLIDNGGNIRPSGYCENDRERTVTQIGDLSEKEYFKNWYYKFIPFVK